MRFRRVVYDEEILSLSDEVEVEWKDEGGVGWLSDTVAEHFGMTKNNETSLKTRVLNTMTAGLEDCSIISFIIVDEEIGRAHV